MRSSDELGTDPLDETNELFYMYNINTKTRNIKLSQEYIEDLLKTRVSKHNTARAERAKARIAKRKSKR